MHTCIFALFPSFFGGRGNDRTESQLLLQKYLVKINLNMREIQVTISHILRWFNIFG
jgi:hypothetical protein